MHRIITKIFSNFFGRKKITNRDLNKNPKSQESDYHSGYYSDFDRRAFSHDSDKSPKETFTRPSISNDNTRGE